MLAMGARFLCAGILLALVLGLRSGFSRLRVTRAEFASCAFLGLMLPVLGNGVVALGESKGAPSGLTALLIATTPLTIMIFRGLAGERPSRISAIGVLIGLVGVLFLVLTSNSAADRVPLVATGLVLAAATFWAFGSWYQPRLTMPDDAFTATVHEMLIGGVILLLFGFLRGERAGLTGHPTEAWIAWAYLVVFGSMVAYTAYVWLLAHGPISLVATYAYVNPVVAVALGALILSEVVSAAMLIGGGLIVIAVAVVISVERPRPTADEAEAPVP